MTITSVKNRPVLTPPDEFTWPGDFTRIPDQEWTRQPVDQFGLNYDDVGNHGWYKNVNIQVRLCGAFAFVARRGWSRADFRCWRGWAASRDSR